MALVYRAGYKNGVPWVHACPVYSVLVVETATATTVGDLEAGIVGGAGEVGGIAEEM